MINDLYEYGQEAEDAVINYFKEFGLNPERREIIQGDAKSIIDNMKFGDLYITHPGHYRDRVFNFDVKRGCFISDKSINNYRGQYYILIPGGDLTDIGKARVVKSSTIKRYYNNIPLNDRLLYNKKFSSPSESDGYRFTMIKNHILLEDFIPEVVKRLIILNDQYDFEKEISPMGELSIMFNKVLPENVNPEYLERYGRYYNK